MNLLDRAPLDLLLAVPRVGLVWQECRNLLSAERRSDSSACQRPAWPGISADAGTLPDNSSSGCMISLMAHFRLHQRYKELQEKSKQISHRALIISLDINLTSQLYENYARRSCVCLCLLTVLLASFDVLKSNKE